VKLSVLRQNKFVSQLVILQVIAMVSGVLDCVGFILKAHGSKYEGKWFILLEYIEKAWQ